MCPWRVGWAMTMYYIYMLLQQFGVGSRVAQGLCGAGARAGAREGWARCEVTCCWWGFSIQGGQGRPLMGQVRRCRGLYNTVFVSFQA